MNNYKRITRLYEQEAVSSSDFEELGMQPEMEDSVELPQDDQLALPAAGESSAEADPMNMTVNDFMAKCKEIDPLVCMGLEAFIEKNKDKLGVTPAEMPNDSPEEDLNFSAQIEPTDSELNFPG